MSELNKLIDFGFSRYETACYSALVVNHPSNGSRLSKISGIARSRIYDVLRNLVRKGLAFEIEPGFYVPLPPEELKKRLRSRFEGSLSALEDQLHRISGDSSYEYILSIRGYEAVLQKAVEIIDNTGTELYVRLFPETGRRLESHLGEASRRGVGVRYISMGPVESPYSIQIVHPSWESMREKIGGESLDIIADKSEALVGVFEDGRRDVSPVIWTRNKWFVVANRDSLRHDFYHYFLYKVYDQKKPLSEAEKAVYAFIKADD